MFLEFVQEEDHSVLRCMEKEFLALDRADILAYRKSDFQTDVLVSDGCNILSTDSPYLAKKY